MNKAEAIATTNLVDFVLAWRREDKLTKSVVGQDICFDRYANYFRAYADKIEE